MLLLVCCAITWSRDPSEQFKQTNVLGQLSKTKRFACYKKPNNSNWNPLSAEWPSRCASAVYTPLSFITPKLLSLRKRVSSGQLKREKTLQTINHSNPTPTSESNVALGAADDFDDPQRSAALSSEQAAVKVCARARKFFSDEPTSLGLNKKKQVFYRPFNSRHSACRRCLPLWASLSGVEAGDFCDQTAHLTHGYEFEKSKIFSSN